MTMIPLPKSRLSKRALPAIAAMLAFASPAPAQSGAWKWLDAQGRTVYSDRPPPAGARISQLKAPDGRIPAGVSSTTPAGPLANSASEPAGAAPSASSWVERERQSRQRAAERNETDAKQAQASQLLADRQRACKDTRAGLEMLESGVRMQAVDDKGEPIALDDAERSRRAQTLRRVLSENCTQPPT